MKKSRKINIPGRREKRQSEYRILTCLSADRVKKFQIWIQKSTWILSYLIFMFQCSPCSLGVFGELIDPAFLCCDMCHTRLLWHSSPSSWLSVYRMLAGTSLETSSDSDYNFFIFSSPIPNTLPDITVGTK